MKRIVITIVIVIFIIIVMLIIATYINDNKVRSFSMENYLFNEVDGNYNDMVQRFLDSEEFGPTQLRERLKGMKGKSNIDELLLGRTETPKDVKRKAEAIWVAIYGKGIKKTNRPYVVSYDSEREVWLVEGSVNGQWYLRIIEFFFGTTEGGAPSILIQKNDGKILAVWHDK